MEGRKSLGLKEERSPADHRGFGSGLTCYPRVVFFQRNMLYSASERRGDEARPI
jgi:hypothetical protein